MAAWFREHGYDFFAFTEHDTWEDREAMSAPGFLVINGIELTRSSGSYNGVHVGAIGVGELLPVPEDMHGKIATVLQYGGIPILNHPTWSMEITGAWDRDVATAVEDVLDADVRHVEVWNTHTRNWITDPRDDEAFWERLLSRGKRIFAVADDDNHGLQDIGGAWNMVWARELTKEAILEALWEGRFYASTGATVFMYRVHHQELEVYSNGDRVEVLGPGGELRAEVAGGEISYDFSGEPWVRVRVSLGDARAWLQPAFPDTEISLGEPPGELPDDPDAPTIVQVVDTTDPSTTSATYPGADINYVFAQLPSGVRLLPVTVVPELTDILDPEGRSVCTDPEEVLRDGLHCGPDWAGFVCLGAEGGKVAVRFERGLVPGTRIYVQEVDRAVCPTASAIPETWRALVCTSPDEDTCTRIGSCDSGGECDFQVPGE